MVKSANQKKKLMVLRGILLEKTDSGHGISMSELIRSLAAHGIKAERKSVYDDLNALRELGVDVKTKRGRGVSYYVGEREFSSAELKLLADAAGSSKFIPLEKSRELNEKLASLAGVNERRSLKRDFYVSSRGSGRNDDIFKNIDVIFDSINDDRDMEFRYFGWDARKNKKYHRGGRTYRVSPWSLIWDDSNYYLAGYDHESKEMRHFRVDTMENAASLPESKRTGRDKFEKYDVASACAGAMFGMFGGKPERVTLRCDEALANVMIDRFGQSTVILNDGDTFSIHVNVVPGETFYGWVAGFGGRVRVLAPEQVAAEYSALLKKADAAQRGPEAAGN